MKYTFNLTVDGLDSEDQIPLAKMLAFMGNFFVHAHETDTQLQPTSPTKFHMHYGEGGVLMGIWTMQPHGNIILTFNQAPQGPQLPPTVN